MPIRNSCSSLSCATRRPLFKRSGKYGIRFKYCCSHACGSASSEWWVARMTAGHDHITEQYVDVPELLGRVEHDHDLMLELLGVFKEEFPRLLESLQNG